MSGVKETTVRVPENELIRLTRLADEAVRLRKDNSCLQQACVKNAEVLAGYGNHIRTMHSNMESLNRRLAEQGASASKEAQALRTQIQQTVRDSNARIQEAYRKNEERILQMQQNFTQELSNAISVNNRRIEDAMQRNTQMIEGEIHELEARVSSEMKGIHERLDTMASNHAALLHEAAEYGNNARALLEETNTKYRVELLCPGRVQSVLTQLKSAGKEIEDARKMPENSTTARREARAAFEEAFRLYQDVLKAEQEWQLRFEDTRQTVAAASIQLEANRELELPGELGDSVKVDVDFWTEGDLTAINSRIEALERQMDRPEGLSISDLDGIKAAGFQAGSEICDATKFALMAICASQHRFDNAQDIADRLSEMGLVIIAQSYRGEDCRDSYRLHMINKMTMFEMVITHTPVEENGKIDNKLESDILNYGTYDEDYGNAIARSVLSILSDQGLEQGEIRTIQHSVSTREEVRDMERWREERSSEVLKPRHAVLRTV